MNAIELNIKGKNVLRGYCKALVAHILPQLTQHVGKKIFTLSGKAAKFVIDLDSIPSPVTDTQGEFIKVTYCYLNSKWGQLVVNVSICINGGSYENRTAYCEYFNREIGLGNLDNSGQILESVGILENIIKDYGFDEVTDFNAEIEKIKKYKALQAEADKVKNTIKISGELYKYL